MKAISNIRAVMAILIFFFSLSFVSCTEETLDYNNPDVDLFVKQLKAGKYSVESPEGLNTIPRFTVDDIGDLLKYAEDLTVIPSFPLAPVSYSADYCVEKILAAHDINPDDIVSITDDTYSTAVQTTNNPYPENPYAADRKSVV